jgi:DNA-binding NarL/FixJ family response regulator
MPPPVFTEKEIKIAQLIFRQLTNEQIGLRLKMPQRTVETVRLKMARKMKAKNSVGIVLYALRHGWVKL